MEITKFKKLYEVVEKLRDPSAGCPWDLEQTHESLLKYLIEESFEYVDAVEKKDTNSMKDELGDVLLQVVLHSVIATQNKSFDINDVCENLSNKLIRRHPHVFEHDNKLTSKEVTENWQKIKSEEKGNPKEYFISESDIMNTALNGANTIGVKSSKINFDWTEVNDVILKVEEELEEVKVEIKENNIDKIEEELGDLLFSVAQLSRHLGFNPENTLKKANQKFLKRINKMEDIAQSDNKDISKLTNAQMEALWNNVKQNEIKK
jgi:MazG family protein